MVVTITNNNYNSNKSNGRKNKILWGTSGEENKVSWVRWEVVCSPLKGDDWE